MRPTSTEGIWFEINEIKNIKIEDGWLYAISPRGTAGYYKLPDVKDYRLNKYGLPSHMQLDLDVRYKFAKTFEGPEAQLLFVGKIKI
jgi:hypothetical protein